MYPVFSGIMKKSLFDTPVIPNEHNNGYQSNISVHLRVVSKTIFRIEQGGDQPIRLSPPPLVTIC